MEKTSEAFASVAGEPVSAISREVTMNATWSGASLVPSSGVEYTAIATFRAHI